MPATKAVDSKTFFAYLVAFAVTGLILFTRYMPSESLPLRVDIFSTARALPSENQHCQGY